MDPINALCLQGVIIIVIHKYVFLLTLFAKRNSISSVNHFKKYLKQH